MPKIIDNNQFLHLFFLGEEHHVRDVARRCHVNPTTASTYLEKLARKGFLTKRKSIGATIYAPNNTNPDFIFEKKIWNLRRVHESSLITFLDKQLAYPTVILFGSWAKGENHKESDLDIFVLAEEKKELDLSTFKKELGEIQLFLHTPKEFRTLRTKNKELANNILNGIILSGRLEVY